MLSTRSLTHASYCEAIIVRHRGVLPHKLSQPSRAKCPVSLSHTSMGPLDAVLLLLAAACSCGAMNATINSPTMTSTTISIPQRHCELFAPCDVHVSRCLDGPDGSYTCECLEGYFGKPEFVHTDGTGCSRYHVSVGKRCTRYARRCHRLRPCANLQYAPPRSNHPTHPLAY